MTPPLTDDLIVGVGDALEAAGFRATMSEVRAATDELVKRFPAIADGAPKPRAHWHRWTPDEYAELERLFHAGATYPDICATLGRTRGAVNGALTRLHLTRRPKETGT